MSCGSGLGIVGKHIKNKSITSQFKLTPRAAWRLLRAQKRAFQMEWRFINEVYDDLYHTLTF